MRRLRRRLDYWLREVIAPNRAAATYENYELFSRLCIKPGLGAKRLDRLQVRDVQAWINKIPSLCQCCAQEIDTRRVPAKQKCCAVGRCCHRHPSARTIGNIRSCLRSALSRAIREEQISRNPAALVELPAKRKPRRKAWTSEEARRFLESARTERIRSTRLM